MCRPVTRRQCGRLGLAALMAPLLALGGCAGLGLPTVITLHEDELQRWLTQRFPQAEQGLGPVQLRLLAPRLWLLPEENRLAVALRVAVQMAPAGQALDLDLAFSSALRLAPEDQTVRLVQVRANPPRGRPTGPVGAPVADASYRIGHALAAPLVERLLENRVVYRLTAERQAELRRLGLALTAVAVTTRGVEITLARTA